MNHVEHNEPTMLQMDRLYALKQPASTMFHCSNSQDNHMCHLMRTDSNVSGMEFINLATGILCLGYYDQVYTITYDIGVSKSK
jgi:hypothetical protein